MIDPLFHPKLHFFPVFMGHQYKSQEQPSSLWINRGIPRNQQQTKPCWHFFLCFGWCKMKSIKVKHPKSKQNLLKSIFSSQGFLPIPVISLGNKEKVFPRGKLEVVLINTSCSWSFCIKIGIFLIFVSSFLCRVREGEKGKKSWGKPQQRPRKVEKRGKSHGLRELLF